jgi:hypothetical protein
MAYLERKRSDFAFPLRKTYMATPRRSLSRAGWSSSRANASLPFRQDSSSPKAELILRVRIDAGRQHTLLNGGSDGPVQ